MLAQQPPVAEDNLPRHVSRAIISNVANRLSNVNIVTALCFTFLTVVVPRHRTSCSLWTRSVLFNACQTHHPLRGGHLLIDHNAIVVSPDHCIRFVRTGINELALERLSAREHLIILLMWNLHACRSWNLQQQHRLPGPFSTQSRCCISNQGQSARDALSVARHILPTWTSLARCKSAARAPTHISRLPSNPPQANMTFLP